MITVSSNSFDRNGGFAIAGLKRVRVARAFRYLRQDGRPCGDAATLKRIVALVIPPAWRQVWINGSPHGRLQATGRDARGRKQYLYHPRWRAVRDAAKYQQLIQFGEALPKLRARVRRDLGQRGLTSTKVLATIVRLLDRTQLRVGNAQYARANGSYGLTTLRDGHVRLAHGEVVFAFPGKSQVRQERKLHDPELAKIVRRCRDLPGSALFQSVDGAGRRRKVAASEVNRYLREAVGENFTAKTFRTWAATVAAAVRLASEPAPPSRTAARRVLAQVIKEVATTLGNTPAVCRASYVHPAVTKAFLAGRLRLNRGKVADRGLTQNEAATLRFLKSHQALSRR